MIWCGKFHAFRTFGSFFAIVWCVSACQKAPDTSGTHLVKISVRYPLGEMRPTYAPFVVAQKKGYYAKEGLDVHFNFTSGALNPISAVVGEKDDLGIMGGLDSVVMERGKGTPIKAVAILHRNSNFVCLITLKSSGITKVSQLEGKTVGIKEDHISTPVLRSLFRSQGVTVTEDNVNESKTKFILGRIAARWAFTTADAVELPEAGTEVNVISPADYGIQTHGYTIFALDDYIKDHPENIRKFLRATFAGVTYAIDHPDDAAQMIVDSDSSQSLKLWQVRKRLGQINAVTTHLPPYFPGYMDDQMIDETYRRLEQVGKIDKPYPPADVFTREFLQK